MAKKNLFKGLAATFALVLPVAAYMSVLAFDREGDINLALGITAGLRFSFFKYTWETASGLHWLSAVSHF